LPGYLSLSRNYHEPGNCNQQIEPCTKQNDLGRLAHEWLTEGKNFKGYDDFVATKLKDFIGLEKKVLVPRDVVLYGFGRIGRLAARILIEHAGSGHQLRLKGIVTREYAGDDLEKRASLLRKDSIHGRLQG